MTSTGKNYFRGELTEINRKFKWILHNFSSLSATPGSSVTSPKFSHWLPGYNVEADWKIVLYPNGRDDKAEGYISLAIKPINYYARLTPYIFNFTVFSSVRNYTNFSIRRKLFDNSLGLGKDKLIKRDILLTDLKKGNDLLTIVVKMVFSDKPQQAKPRDNLLQDIELLLKTEENSDVILISGDGNEHKAHKAILMCRSKVFSAMFRHNMKESQDNIVRIEDLDNNTLKAVLQFLYTGKLECMPDKTKNILIAADKYELDDLKRMCIDYLQENIRCDNVLDLVELAHNYDFGELKIKAKKYILQNYKEIMSMRPESIKDLSRCILEELFHNVMENQK